MKPEGLGHRVPLSLSQPPSSLQPSTPPPFVLSLPVPKPSTTIEKVARNEEAKNERMTDWWLKPSMLRSVVHDRLSGDPTLANLDSVLYYVQTHGLLSELHSNHPAERKLVDAWRSAVDGWVERILSLASSSAPYKCWAGSSLLGVTCGQCCSDRFQSSYATWFQKLLENFQSPSATDFIKVACCASLSDLFTRLACFPNLKKDGTLFARKVIQPVLQTLNEDAGETLWDIAVNLLCTLISSFPSSLQQHYGNVEAALTSKIMAAKCNLDTSKKISRGLAMLPKVKGDEDSWCLVIQKILIAINSILTDAFQGLEEEKKSSEVMKMIVPPGKNPPLPLGGQTLSGEASEPATRRLSELLVPRVTTLMHSCCIMLTDPYPSSVSIPVRSLLATVGRVLQVDGYFRGSLFHLTTSMHQELLCAELPTLHLCSLDFLIAIINCLRSQLLPHGANVVRLLTEFFPKARMPSIRIKVYSILHMLLISMGVGMSLYLAQEVINNAFADLTDNLELGDSATLSNMQSSIVVSETFETFQQNYHRKRKHASVIPVEHPNGVDLSIKTCSKKSQAPLSLKIAALKALEALLTMGGSLGSESWRPDVDCLVVTVATNACDAGWANEYKLPMSADESSFADYKLATLEVLLASLLSPTQTRPAYLSQGLDLFRRGRREPGSKIAAFCGRALLSLEVLLHPRALPLVDHILKNLSVDEGFNQRFAGSTFNNGIKTSLPSFSKGDLGILDEEDEELSNGWFDKNDGQTFSESRNLNDKSNEITKQFSNASEDITMKPSAINAEVSHHVENSFLQNVDVEMACLGKDETTADREKTEECRSRNEISFYNASHNKMDFVQGSSTISVAEMASGKSDSPLVISTNMSNHNSDAPNLSAEMSKEDATYKRLPDLYKGKDAMLSYDSDSDSLDSLPDIIDGDPDTE